MVYGGEAMSDYSCGRSISLQLVNGGRLPIRFLIASSAWKSNSSELFSKIGCDAGPHASTDCEEPGVLFFFLTPNGRLTPVVTEEGPYHNG
jgi:hypothetical protein